MIICHDYYLIFYLFVVYLLLKTNKYSCVHPKDMKGKSLNNK